MDANDVERHVTAKVAWRFVPFLMLCYFVAYLDRVNLGFATLSMNKDLGITDRFRLRRRHVLPRLFPLRSAIEPRARALRRTALDRADHVVLVTSLGCDGLLPAIAGTDFSGENSFYFLRVLLGFAEAGFFPGIIFFLTLWFPAVYRARIVGCFMAAIPLSSALGSPVSA